MVMVANQKTKTQVLLTMWGKMGNLPSIQVATDLVAFLGDNAKPFTDWWVTPPSPVPLVHPPPPVYPHVTLTSDSPLVSPTSPLQALDAVAVGGSREGGFRFFFP